MPEISRFYGIIIKMFYEKSGKHSKPYIHVYYGEDKSGFTHIVSVQPLSNRMLLLQFSTGRKKLFDTTLLTGPVFEPLNSEEIFRNIVLDHGVVTWKDGTIDCEPEYMYTHGFDYTMVS